MSDSLTVSLPHCRHVERANKEQAIDILLLADSLFRSNDIAERKKYVTLVESVREQVR